MTNSPPPPPQDDEFDLRDDVRAANDQGEVREPPRIDDGGRQTPPKVDEEAILRLELGPLSGPKVVSPVPPVTQESDDDRPIAPSEAWRDRLTGRETISGAVSMIVHLTVIILLATLFIRVTPTPRTGLITSTDDGPPIEMPTEEFEIEPDDPMMLTTATDAETSGESEILIVSVDDVLLGSGLDPTPGEETTASDLWRELNAPRGGGYSGRSAEYRQKLAQQPGPGSPTGASESAVEGGLVWLKDHQMPDGGWRFDIDNEQCPCKGRCRDAGTNASTTAATGLALLSYLGAGYTQEQGPYKKVVRDGLYYLERRARRTQAGVDLQDGVNMYGQGIATFAICEAYLMTKDPGLRELAQGAVDFIVAAQNPNDGGWRYHPGQPGDATVTAWQFMAIKSAYNAGLHVDRKVVYMAEKFFDSVESDDGAQYGYQDRNPRHSTTAIGLLSRMYSSGWSLHDPAIGRGVGLLETWGPSETDMYYDYYATLVLHHFGGTPFNDWDEKMRPYLVRMQSRQGHEAGSWHFPDRYGDKGGRLYNTCMAIMILEVYYRFLPLYKAN